MESCCLQAGIVWLPLFLFECPLFLSLAWLLCLGLPVLCWIREDIFFLCQLSRGMLPAFPHSVWCWLWVCYKWLLLFLGILLQYLFYWEFLISLGVLSIAYSASIEIIMQLLSLVLFTWWKTFIDLCMLKQPFILGMKPSWSW